MNEISEISVFVKQYCSPKREELTLVEREYSFLQTLLEGESFQSGSYTRFTATTPLNDLDVIWVISKQQAFNKRISGADLDIRNLLQDLAIKLESEYLKNKRNVTISAQTHSVVIKFLDDNTNFTIDVVPAMALDEFNEFGDRFYEIPEVGFVGKNKRANFYNSLSANHGHMKWVKTDPKGYKRAAQLTNDSSPTFRRSTKLLKKWKCSWKVKMTDQFKLKSFHIEMIIHQFIQRNPSMGLLDIMKLTLQNMSDYLKKPQFQDRAQKQGEPIRYIDQYVSELTTQDRAAILSASRSGLVLLNKFRDGDSNDDIVELLHRFLACEEDITAMGFKFPAHGPLRDTKKFKIDGFVRKLDGFPHGWLSESVSLQKGLSKGKKSRKIDFKAVKKPDGKFVIFWKVRNIGREALTANSLRGEITRNQTKQTPESTAYKGDHFVEAYLINEDMNEIVLYDRLKISII